MTAKYKSFLILIILMFIFYPINSYSIDFNDLLNTDDEINNLCKKIFREIPIDLSNVNKNDDNFVKIFRSLMKNVILRYVYETSANAQASINIEQDDYKSIKNTKENIAAQKLLVGYIAAMTEPNNINIKDKAKIKKEINEYILVEDFNTTIALLLTLFKKEFIKNKEKYSDTFENEFKKIHNKIKNDIIQNAKVCN